MLISRFSGSILVFEKDTHAFITSLSFGTGHGGSSVSEANKASVLSIVSSMGVTACKTSNEQFVWLSDSRFLLCLVIDNTVSPVEHLNLMLEMFLSIVVTLFGQTGPVCWPALQIYVDVAFDTENPCGTFQLGSLDVCLPPTCSVVDTLELAQFCETCSKLVSSLGFVSVWAYGALLAASRAFHSSLTRSEKHVFSAISQGVHFGSPGSVMCQIPIWFRQSRMQLIYQRVGPFPSPFLVCFIVDPKASLLQATQVIGRIVSGLQCLDSLESFRLPLPSSDVPACIGVSTLIEPLCRNALGPVLPTTFRGAVAQFSTTDVSAPIYSLSIPLSFNEASQLASQHECSAKQLTRKWARFTRASAMHFMCSSSLKRRDGGYLVTPSFTAICVKRPFIIPASDSKDSNTPVVTLSLRLVCLYFNSVSSVPYHGTPNGVAIGSIENPESGTPPALIRTTEGVVHSLARSDAVVKLLSSIHQFSQKQ